MQCRVVASLYDDQCVPRQVLGGDEPRRFAGSRQAAHAETAALAERVALESAVPADDGAVRGLDQAGTGWQPGSDELAKGSLADETDSRRVALAGDRQAALARHRTDFGLAQSAHRKFAGRQLGRIERMEEIALVLAAVDAAQEPAAMPDARIVTRCESLSAQPARVIEPHAELDLAIAEHVGIRRATGLKLGKEMRKDALAVLVREACLVNRDSQFVGDAPRVLEILSRRAITLVVLDPVRHKQAFDLMAGLDEERSRDCGVHATGERDDDAGHDSARDPAQRREVPRHVVQHVNRIARAEEVVVDAKLDQQTAMFADAGAQLVGPEPQRADDGAIQLRVRRTLADPARERDPKHRPARRALPEIQARDMVRPEFPPCFLAGLAHDGLDQRFPVLEMPGGLVQHDAACGPLLDQQETAVLLGNRRYGQVDLQGHGRIIGD